MKNKVIWILVGSLLVFAVFLGMMCRWQQNGTFSLKDIEGQREYLNIFPVEGVAGDGTHGVIFRIEEGELSTTFYPFGTEEIKNLFYADRRAIMGLERYSYNYYENGFSQELTAFIDSAPSADAKIRRKEGIHEAVLESGYFNDGEFASGETVYADKVDIYMGFWEVNGGREARVATGMYVEKEVYYTRGNRQDGRSSYTESSFTNIEMQSYLVKAGDAYYGLVASTRECRGATGLFRIQEEDLRAAAPEEEGELYQQKEYGGAKRIRTFPVDAHNRVLGMFALGDNAFGIFRIEDEKLLFEVYDVEGKLTNQDVLPTEQGDKIDYAEAEVVAWDGGDVSVHYRMYEVVEQNENTQVWSCVEDGLYQINEEGLKRMNCYDKSSGMFLTACRNNLIFDASTDLGEETKASDYYGSQLYLSVMNGDTGKMLYQGKLETNYYEDSYKKYSKYNIAKKAPYLKEAMQTQSADGMIEQRQRQFVELAPTNGKVGDLWWR